MRYHQYSIVGLEKSIGDLKMYVYSLTATITLLVIAVILAVILPPDISPYIIVMLIAIIALAGSTIASISRYIEDIIYDILLGEFWKAGAPLPRGYSILITITFIFGFLIFTSSLIIFFVAIVLGLTAIYQTTIILIISSLSLAAGVLTILLVSTLSPRIILSFKKFGTNVELPFLLAMLRVFSRTHLSLYEIFKLVSESIALKSWSSEVRERERIARSKGVSFLTAMAELGDEHPSEAVRDIIKRLMITGSYVGNPADVIDRISDTLFEDMRGRLERLTGYMYIALGILMISLLLIPLLASTLAPILGIPSHIIAFSAVAVAVPLVIAIYSLVQSLYPSGFMFNPPRVLKFLFTGSLFILVSSLLVSVLAMRVGSKLNLAPLYTLMVVSLIPPLVLTLAYWSRVSVYERLLKLTSDAAEMSHVTGENIVTIMLRLAEKDRVMSRVIEDLEKSIIDDRVRVRLVSGAPNLLYASFVENLIYSLRIGSPVKALIELARVYDNLNNILSRHKSAMRGVELSIAVVAGALSVYVAYMLRMLTSIVESVKAQGVSLPPLLARFQIVLNMDIIQAIIIAMAIAALSLGIIVEKAKNGTVFTSSRTILLYMVIVTAGIIAVLLTV
ncbi:MAG: type II secretion system F family protein [Acidilobaceae archaeon]